MQQVAKAVRLTIAALCLLSFGCSDSPNSKGKIAKNSSSNSAVNNVVTTCGNGNLDAGEACDPGIESGAGACPTSCEGDAECGTLVLDGTAAACSARCVVEPNACGDADGCCPVGCDSGGDGDCSNTCGNGVLETPELCDGDCPAMCDDGVACTIDSLEGSADTCNAVCTSSPITACANDDGCCPSGCTADDDNDCSGSCGDGTVDPGEVCDGDCPTSCDTGAACTRGTLVGSASSCSAQCSTSSITTCQNADGCCPSGCTFSNDNDCSCTPSTCGQLGAECGSVGDGCGSALNCGGCSNGEMCVNNACVATNTGSVGNPCTSDGQCGAGAGCLTQSTTQLPGGYCTVGCSGDSDCPSNNCWEESGICVDPCNSNADCRTGYGCWDWTGDGIDECGPIGTGSGNAGDPCTGYGDCSGGEGGFCIINPDFPQGYCTDRCITNSDCSSGAHCADNGICVDNCTSSCRTGYECYDFDDVGVNECWPSAIGSGPVGAACASTQDCAGGEFGICARADQGDPNAWPGGYCIVFCGSGQTTCPSGSECFDPDGSGSNSFCLDVCSTNSDCRSGYTCDANLGTVDSVCIY